MPRTYLSTHTQRHPLVARLRSLALPCAIASLALAAAACGDDDDDDTDTGEPARPYTEATAVTALTDYATLAFEAHDAAASAAATLASATSTFAANPPLPGALDTARTAYKDARAAYAAVEAFRNVGGPLDTGSTAADERINTWPITPRYLDEVPGSPGAGIVNNPAAQPDLSRGKLAALNGVGGVQNFATGFGVVEFLAYGIDNEPAGPGSRPATDFYSDQSATLSNGFRRATLFKETAGLIADDLAAVRDEWLEETEGNYRANLAAEPTEIALPRLFDGLAKLLDEDLGTNLVDKLVASRNETAAIAPFSDTTGAILAANFSAAANVITGVRKEGEPLTPLATVIDEILADETGDDTTVLADALRAAADRIGTVDETTLADTATTDNLTAAADAARALAARLRLAATRIRSTLDSTGQSI